MIKGEAKKRKFEMVSPDGEAQLDFSIKLSKKIGVILYGREYWDQVLNVKPMAEWGAIADKDIELLHYADTPADAFDQLKRHLEEHHIEPDKPAKAPGLAITRG